MGFRRPPIVLLAGDSGTSARPGTQWTPGTRQATHVRSFTNGKQKKRDEKGLVRRRWARLPTQRGRADGTALPVRDVVPGRAEEANLIVCPS